MSVMLALEGRGSQSKDSQPGYKSLSQLLSGASALSHTGTHKHTHTIHIEDKGLHSDFRLSCKVSQYYHKRGFDFNRRGNVSDFKTINLKKRK